MKRFVIAAAVATVLFVNASTASAQYRGGFGRGPVTMTGRNLTMTGRNFSNHNHLTPQRVGGTSYYSPYTGGVYPPGTISPYNAGAGILPNNGGIITPGPGVYSGGNYYNPSVWSRPGGYGHRYGRRW